MAYDFSEFKDANAMVLGWLRKEYSSIRTNQVTSGILDAVSVEAYGSRMPINQVASILGSGPRSLIITPWDSNVAPNIDRAIRESNLGLSVSLDAQGVRVFFPELTSERRTLLTKLVKEKFEEARVKVRAEREKSLETLDRSEKEGVLSKDDKFRLKNELQKLVDDINQQLEELVLKKEKEILT
ncbi:MAG: ribosome recycling factor [Candidatus Zambryskibacteria bacterium RIFOXYD2_FULL_43_10]|uniref:Ribosome recycling factor n=1 Tax=Candidatus Zambryskibacteria bacterium RIFOXYD2_FULL_43_10 TaxID=1802782 RepID=A0A1G2V6I3_9BACT|nr:MAG: ribosome recycling factor [Candidatus Zambryskibacteria bacterium RIFOXYD2_FULL_43_10]